tara:strand:+ start:2059 stop:3747 length:1689 start_codon:yes stop_codon:yes gene_type:complete
MVINDNGNKRDQSWEKYFGKIPFDDEFWTNPKHTGSIVGSISVEQHPQNLWWLYKMWTEGKVASLENFLQRPLLDAVWRAVNSLKAKEYITSACLGTSVFDGFIFVPIMLISDEVTLLLIDEQKSGKPDADVVSQLKQFISEIKTLVQTGVELLCLDGQTRSNEGVVKFFNSEFELPSDGCGGFMLEVELLSGVKVTVNRNNFSDLTPEVQHVLKSVPISTLVITQGSITLVIASLINKQQMVPWTEFQKILLSKFCSAFSKKIVDVLSSPTRDLLKNKVIMSQKYSESINGFEYYIAIMLWYKRNKSMVDYKNEIFANSFRPGLNQIRSMDVDELNITMKELREWVGATTTTSVRNAQGKVKERILTTYILFRDKLFELKIKYKILSSSGFVEWFIKKHEYLRAEQIPDLNSKKNAFGQYATKLNDESYYYFYPEDKTKPIPTKLLLGYCKSVEDSLQDSSAAGRVQEKLLFYFNQDLDYLIKNNIIQIEEPMPDKEQTAVKSGWVDVDGDEMSAKGLLIERTHDRGHILSKKNQGSNNLKNIVPQKSGPNKEYQDESPIN